jgi:hypothetical protein
MNTKSFREEMEALAKQRSFYDDFVLPDYERFNVVNVSAMIGNIFGIDSLSSAKFPNEYLDDFHGVEKVLLIIVDGLGYHRLLAHIDNYGGMFSEMAEKGVLKPLTSTFPATTSTSLTSIFTGLQPSEHNLIGYQMFSKEYGLIYNTLDMKPIYGYSSRIEIAKELSKKIRPWTSLLEEHHVRTYVVTRGSLIGSGLSKVVHRDEEMIPYMLDSEMFAKCGKVLEQQSRTLLMAYYSGIDAMEHKYGPCSEEVTFEMQSFEYNLKNFLNKLSDVTRQRTLILITADHGVSETSRAYYLKDTPEIVNDLLLPPVGDSRATFLFAKQGRSKNLEEAFLRSTEGFRLLQSKELIEAGAFGQAANSSSLEATVGDFTALSTSQNVLLYPFFDEERTREPLGSHGGMTAEEIIIPLLSLKLSKV